jgi:5-phospho-D-xylono-1,4-lactonase
VKVRTVLGDVDPGTLGATLMHEHLILDNALIEREHPHIHLPSVDEAVHEVEPCARAGIGCMVDAMPAAGGRHPERLADISRRTGVAIVATTGLHTPKYYPHHRWALEADVDALAALFIADIDDGIDRFDYTGPVVERTTHRAGVIKVATPEPTLTERCRRVFRAAAIAARSTGAPILTHCEDGVGAERHIEAFTELGFPLHRVVISHTDKVADQGYHTDLLAAGVCLEYDQAIRHSPDETNPTALLIAAAVSGGFGDQIMLGTDGARRTLWATLGGSPGLAWMRSGFLDELDRVGVGSDAQDAIFARNPQRFLAFEDAA